MFSEKTVLVVDDSRVMRTFVKNTFKVMKLPCTIIEAADGQEALNKLSQNNINLVLLDWNMPNLSGIEFLKLARSRPSYKDLPIVMVTSEGGRVSIIEAMKAGATDYIIKPLTDKIFMEKVLKYVSN